MPLETVTKVEPTARMMKAGDVLYTAKKGNRVIFESPDEPNTTVTPIIGSQLEFDRGVKVGIMTALAGDLLAHTRRCIFRQVWRSADTGESKDALEFEHFLVYLEQIEPGQKVRVL